MRIAIHTMGTRGEVQPYVALARGLPQAGYQGTIATAARFEQLVLSHGVEFAPLRSDLLDLMDTPVGRAAMSGGSKTWTTTGTERLYVLGTSTLTPIQRLHPVRVKPALAKDIHRSNPPGTTNETLARLD